MELDDKELTSSVEASRLVYEETAFTKGEAVLPQQIWRDGKLLPTDTAPSVMATETVQDGSTSFKYGEWAGRIVEKKAILAKYEKVPLKRIKGTKYVYCSAFVSNAISDLFAPDGSYSHKMFLMKDGSYQRMGYMLGNPRIDQATGFVEFRDKAYIDSLGLDQSTEYPFAISFYRYIGHTGFFGANDGIYGPFKDDLSLIRKADDDTATARFLVRGGPKDSRYVLPQVGNGAVPTGFYYEKGASEADAGVIVLQENINEVLWNVGDIDCGIYSAAGITRTFRH